MFIANRLLRAPDYDWLPLGSDRRPVGDAMGYGRRLMGMGSVPVRFRVRGRGDAEQSNGREGKPEDADRHDEFSMPGPWVARRWSGISAAIMAKTGAKR
jgi:hypothetical protein